MDTKDENKQTPPYGGVFLEIFAAYDACYYLWDNGLNVLKSDNVKHLTCLSFYPIMDMRNGRELFNNCNGHKFSGEGT